MQSSSRALVVGGLVAAIAATAPSAFAAQPRLLPAQQFRLAGNEADSRSCAVRTVTGSSALKRALTAPADGYLTVRTSGSATSDWDLGITDRTTGHLLNGSASMTSTEVATTTVRKGQKLAVQVCRRSGTSEGVSVSTQFTKATLGGGTGTMKLVRVLTGDAAEREKLEALGLDLADHGTDRARFAILHSEADVRKLDASGLSYGVRVNDLAARSRANLRREVRTARAARTARRKGRIAQAASALPSGSNQYRTLANIQAELKNLRDANPTLVRLFELPQRTTEGRAIMGIEIARGVGSPTDGRPMMVQVGTHHAREWPANESTLEWGYELIKNFTRDPTYNRPFDPELDRVVNDSRSFVIPVMNVDGFDATIESEGRNPDGSYEDPVDSGGEPGRDTSGDQSEGSGAYKRKTCSDPDPALQAHPVPRAHELPRVPGPDGHGERPAGPRRGPEPQLRRRVGRPRHLVGRRGPHLPRSRGVVGARDAGDARVPARPAADGPDHQPHIHGPDAAPAGHERLRPGARRGPAAPPR